MSLAQQALSPYANEAESAEFELVWAKLSPDAKKSEPITQIKSFDPLSTRVRDVICQEVKVAAIRRGTDFQQELEGTVLQLLTGEISISFASRSGSMLTRDDSCTQQGERTR